MERDDQPRITDAFKRAKRRGPKRAAADSLERELAAKRYKYGVRQLDMEVDVDGDGVSDYVIKPLPVLDNRHLLNRSKGVKSSSMYSKRARTSKVYAPTSSSSKVKTSSGGKVYISGREMLVNVTGKADFTWCPGCDSWKDVGVNVENKSLLITPETTVFTWLNNLAKSFQTYKFKYFNLIYEPSCSTATEGSVILGFNNNNYAKDPILWSSACEWPLTVHGAPWSSIRLNIPPRWLSKRKEFHLQKTSDCNYNDDFKKDPWEYFGGQVGFGVDGQDAPAHVDKTIGKLYVEYGINFYKVQEAGGTVTSASSRSLSTSHFERAGHQTMEGSALDAQCVDALGVFIGDTKFLGFLAAGTAKRSGQNNLILDPVTGVLASPVSQDLVFTFMCDGTGANELVNASELYINGVASGASPQAYLIKEVGKGVINCGYAISFAIHLNPADVLSFNLNTSLFATFHWNIDITPGIFDLHN